LIGCSFEQKLFATVLSKRGKKRVRSRANTTETIERNLDQEEKE